MFCTLLEGKVAILLSIDVFSNEQGKKGGIKVAVFFEDFQVGQSFTTPGRTITETDVVQFAGISGDFNPLHTDSEFAKEGKFGQRIAHGLLGLSVATGLMARLGHLGGAALAFLEVKWKFSAPVYLGDTIHVDFTIAELRETKNPDRGVVIYDVHIVNQRKEMVQVGSMAIMIKRNSSAAH